MTGREILISNKPLCQWWVSVCHDPRFDVLVTLVKSHLAETAESWDALKGANAALNLLGSITDGHETAAPIPSSGIIHDFMNVPHGTPPAAQPPKKE